MPSIMGYGMFWVSQVVSIPAWVLAVIGLSFVGTAYIFWRIIHD